MSYNTQGIATTEGSKRIKISYLFKKGFIQKGRGIKTTMSWSDNWNRNSGNIGIETNFTNEEKWIRLKYTVTDNQGFKTNYDYKINLVPVLSNLGIGNVYYFQCPVSYQKCRVLYMAYSSHYFKCRSAYQNRIYYESQRVSKNYSATNRYFKLEKILEKMNKSRMKKTYKGFETKTYQRYLKLQNDMSNFDNIRWNQLGNVVMKLEKRIKK